VFYRVATESCQPTLTAYAKASAVEEALAVEEASAGKEDTTVNKGFWDSEYKKYTWLNKCVYG
jgi:hypothetical protein